MLYDISKDKVIDRIPHQSKYSFWKSRLSNEDYEKIFEELNNRIDEDEVHTSSWIPGSDWSESVFNPIYITCDNNEDDAAKFFGLILWEVMLNRPEVWSFGRYNLNGIPIEGLTYFRVHIDE